MHRLERNVCLCASLSACESMQKTSVSMYRTGAMIAFYVSYGFHKTKRMYSRTEEVKKGI